MSNSIKLKVFNNLDNALDNGYDQKLDDPEDVAAEMQDLDPDLENVDIDLLVLYITDWQGL